MSIHRGIAVAAFMAILATSACDGSSDRDQPTGAPSATAAPTPTVQASRDAAAEAVPLAGNDDVVISWVLEKVNGSDPVVDVARRTISLLLLASYSPDWSRSEKLKTASDALTLDDSVLLKQLSGAATPKAKTEPEVDRILVQAPVVIGARATVWMCLDQNATASRSKGGSLISVSLRATDGLWKVADYNLDPEITTKLEPRYKRCRAGY